MSAISCHLTSHIHFCQSEQFSIINKNQQRLYLRGRLDLSQKKSPESSVQSRPARFDQRVVSRSDSLEVIVFNKLHIYSSISQARPCQLNTEKIRDNVQKPPEATSEGWWIAHQSLSTNHGKKNYL